MPKSFSERYKQVKAEITNLNKPFKDSLIALAVGLALATILLLGPITLLINCFIFVDYIAWIIRGLAVCLFFLLFLTKVFYYIILTQGQVKNMGIIYSMEALIIFIIICFIQVLVLFIL